MLSSVATDLFQSLLATQKGDEDCPHHAESHLSNLIESTASRLRRIVDELSAIREAREQGGMAPSTVQKGSEVAGVLSLDHMRAVYTAIELLWSTALKPFAVERLPFLTASESRLNYPRTLVIRQNTLNNLSKTCLNLSESDIWNIYSIIFDVIFCPSFSSTMYKRFIKRIVLVHVLLSREESGMQFNNQIEWLITSKHLFFRARNSVFKYAAAGPDTRRRRGMLSAICDSHP